jgi:hypothetical protein
MTETDFHDKVLTALGNIKAEQATALGDLKTELAVNTSEVRNVVERLDVTNGRIAAQERKTGDLQIELAERRLNCPLAAHVQEALITHISGCPLKARLDTVEDFVTSAKEKEKANKSWMDRAWPVIYAFGGILFYLVLVNAGKILEAIGAKHSAGG